MATPYPRQSTSCQAQHMTEVALQYSSHIASFQAIIHAVSQIQAQKIIHTCTKCTLRHNHRAIVCEAPRTSQDCILLSNTPSAHHKLKCLRIKTQLRIGFPLADHRLSNRRRGLALLATAAAATTGPDWAAPFPLLLLLSLLLPLASAAAVFVAGYST